MTFLDLFLILIRIVSALNLGLPFFWSQILNITRRMHLFINL